MSSATPELDSTEYAPMQDYAMISDCRTGALISRQGSIDWLCLPNFSAPPIFGRLLDADKGGCFANSPVQAFDVYRHYREGTNVLETIFETSEGRVRLTDAMPVPWALSRQELHLQREVLRRGEGSTGMSRWRSSTHPDCIMAKQLSGYSRRAGSDGRAGMAHPSDGC